MADHDEPSPVRAPRRRKKKPFRLEARFVPGLGRKTWFMRKYTNWHEFHTSYATERSRDQALRTLRHLNPSWEFRLPK